MKSKVIGWLQSGCDFNEGLKILPSEGCMEYFHRTCRIQGATKGNRQMLEYQLLKHAGITDKEAAILKNRPVRIREEKKAPIQSTEKGSQEEKTHNIPEKQRMKLREEFPFLNDPSCPEELKILVSDKISAYHNYIAAHDRLFTASTKEETFSACRDTVENYIENRLIFAELEYYKMHRKVLGKHPLFRYRKRESEISKMKLTELFKMKERIEMNIWRNNKLIKDEPGHTMTQTRAQKVTDYEFELRVINRLINEK